MSKKNKENISKDTQAPEGDFLIGVTIGSNANSSKQSLVGKIISLNLKVETYFGVGPIWLTPEKYWATIPDGLANRDYDVIQKAISTKKLILGKKYIAPIDKASNICEHYWSLIDRTGFESKNAKTSFNTLLRKGHDSGWTAKEIAQYCLEREEKSKKRPAVVTTLSQIITSYDGPMQLYDPPDTEEGIKKVIINPDGTLLGVTNSGKKVAKPISSTPPKNHVKGNKSAEQAVNDLIK